MFECFFQYCLPKPYLYEKSLNSQFHFLFYCSQVLNPLTNLAFFYWYDQVFFELFLVIAFSPVLLFLILSLVSAETVVPYLGLFSPDISRCFLHFLLKTMKFNQQASTCCPLSIYLFYNEHIFCFLSILLKKL